MVVMEFSSENMKNAVAFLVLMGEETHCSCPDVIFQTKTFGNFL
jgi:hypothetical protein